MKLTISLGVGLQRFLLRLGRSLLDFPLYLGVFLRQFLLFPGLFRGIVNWGELGNWDRELGGNWGQVPRVRPSCLSLVFSSCLVMLVLVGTITLKVFHLPENTARNILHLLLSLTLCVVCIPFVLAHRLLLFTMSSHFQLSR
jgi:hypothetical protein